MNELIIKITKSAALSTKGVASLCSPFDVFVLKRKDKYDIDVFLNVLFGVSIPEVAWDVQENIKRALENQDIKCIEHINIHIQGVKVIED